MNFVSGGDNGGVKHCFLHYQKALQQIVDSPVASVRSNFPCMEELKHITARFEVASYFRTNCFGLRQYSVWRLRKMLQRVKPDLIIVHKNIDFKLLKLASRGLSIRIVGVLHGYNASYCEYADFLIAVSEGVKQFVAQAVPNKKIYTLLNPVDFSKTLPAPFQLHEPIVLGTMALFKRRKRICDLLRVALILKKAGLKFKMKIAGRSWRLMWAYRLQNWSQNTQDVVEFLPWVEDKIKFLDSLDVFCLNSRAEAFGMVITEAMARKKIVVATDCEGPKEILTHGVNGFLVPRLDPEAFAQEILKIANHQYPLGVIAENAFHRAHELDLEHFTVRLQQVLEDVLAMSP